MGADVTYSEIRVGWGDADDEACPNREDGTHCVHWWDGEECCSCHAPADPTVETE